MRLKNVAGYLKRAEQVSVIMGAGASRSAGIPTAPILVKKVNDDFSHCLGDLLEDERRDYGRVMGALAPGDRKSLIQPLLDESQVNWGHIALACITRAINVKRILTFNFDLILEKAASLVGIHLPVYDFGVAPTRELSGLAAPAIFHLHGQSYGLRLMNSEAETIAHKEVLRPLIADSLRNHLTIVIGYSGEADAAFKVMEEEFNSHQNLIWLGFEPEPKPHLAKLLSRDYAFYLGDCDFDRTMIDLAEMLGCWPPEVIKNPPRHILFELSEVASYPVAQQVGLDLLTSTRRRLQDAAELWDGNKDGEAMAQEALISGTAPDPSLAQTQSDDEREARAWASARQALDKLSEAREMSAGEQRVPHLREAISHFEDAIRLAPEVYQLKTGLAGVLLALSANLESDEEAATLEEEALKLLDDAYNVDPEFTSTLRLYATALTRQSGRISGPDAAKAIAKAKSRLDKLLSLDREDPRNLSAYIAYLLRLRETQEGQEKELTLVEVGRYVEQLTRLSGKADYNIACYLAITGDNDGAMDQLLTAYDEKTLPNWRILSRDSDLDGLRQDPRFIALLEKVRI